MPKVTNILEVLNVLGRSRNAPQPAVMPLRLTNVGSSTAAIRFQANAGASLATRLNGVGAYSNWNFSEFGLAAGEYVEVVGVNINRSASIGRFILSGADIAASGSVMSLMYGENITADQNKVILGEHVFRSLFSNCQNLVSAPELPATTVTPHCYESMFRRCYGLTIAPALPAMTLAESCYNDMFAECTNLIATPNLPATSLAYSCYYGMFAGCTSLTTAFRLPAMTLANGCYERMFAECSALTTAPELPATTLDAECYSCMFELCTSLESAPELPATTLQDYCYEYMFSGCSRLLAAPLLPATTLAFCCYDGMFNGCSVITSIKVHFSDWGNDLNATTDWVAGASAIGTFKCPAALPQEFGDNRIPTGWTVETF